MRRRLADILAVVLLGLCVLIAAAWARSHWRWDYLERQAASRACGLSSNSGGVTLSCRDYEGGIWLGLDATWHHRSGPAAAGPAFYGRTDWAIAGFARGGFGPMAPTNAGYTFRDDYWTFPYWFLLLAASVVAAASGLSRLPAWRAAARASGGRCVACGYDLRSTPSRCPECGAATAARSAA